MTATLAHTDETTFFCGTCQATLETSGGAGLPSGPTLWFGSFLRYANGDMTFVADTEGHGTHAAAYCTGCHNVWEMIYPVGDDEWRVIFDSKGKAGDHVESHAI